MNAPAQILAPQTEIAVYAPFRRELATLKQQNASFVFDVGTPQGNKDARSHIYKLKLSKGAIERARKDEKAASLEYGRKVDAQAKEITAELDAMIDVHQGPLDEQEAADAKRIGAIKARIAGLSGHQECRGYTPEQITAAMEALNAVDIDESFAELRAEAANAKDASLKALQAELPVAIEREAQKAEMERLRRELADQAETAAKVKAEREEEDRKVTGERMAAAEREANLKREREKAEQALKDADEQRERNAEAERQRVAEEEAAEAAAEAALQADVAHREKVRASVVEALASYGRVGASDAVDLLDAIEDGAIPHLAITY